MYKNKKILALITARGGSKGIPKKNIKDLGGKPLIYWSIDEAKKSRYIDKLILSSDSAEIIDIAKARGCEVPFVRPAALAEDESTSMEVILHALSLVGDYDYLLLLQPTSPFRTVEHIDAIITMCLDIEASMMISVKKVKKHPFFMYESDAGYLKPLLGFRTQMRRQDLPAVYEHNGALYFAEIDFLKHVKTYNVPQAKLFEMSDIESIDIDDISDWDYAEYLIAKGM